MEQFIININPQNSGEHEVHNKTRGCRSMPDYQNQVDLGFHSSCHSAVASAKAQWPNAKIDGCYYCCNACHTG